MVIRQRNPIPLTQLARRRPGCRPDGGRGCDARHVCGEDGGEEVVKVEGVWGGGEERVGG